jgi:PBSX family phage terminase large subunit
VATPSQPEYRPLTGKHATAVRLATHRLNIWEGAVRSGKTVGTFVAWILFVRTAPPGDLVMVGKTERTLIRNVVRPLQRILGKRRCRLNRGEGELHMLGRTIYLIGANDERAAEKIRGMTLAGGYGDELTIWPESFWEMLLSRFSVEGAQFFGTTNPDNPNHWLAEMLERCVVWLRHDGTIEHFDDEDRVDLDLARFSFVIDDNPTLPERFIRSLKATYSGVFYKRFILGLWVLADGVIWDSWNEDHHVVGDAQLPDLSRYQVAIDDGTAGTFAAQLGALGADGTLVVVRELRWNAKERQRQLSDAQKSQLLREWLTGCEAGTWTDDGAPLPALDGAANPIAIHVDPSATSLIRQLELDGWRGIVGRARNDVRDGLQYVASLLTIRRLVVHESCHGLRKEIPGYVWDPKAAARGEDKPIKANDHHCDALRYLVMGCADWWWHWLEQPRERTDSEAA